MPQDAAPGRLAELTIALSLATDLGTGQPLEHGLRTCWLSMAVADALDVPAPVRSDVYFVALLRFVGCTSDASDTAVMAGGDDIELNATMGPYLLAPSRQAMRFFVRHLAEDLTLPRRLGRVAKAMTDPGMVRRSAAGHCEVAARLATRLGLAAGVTDALAHAFERWDGKGHPSGQSGDEVPLAVRIVSVARDVDLWSRDGWDGALDVLTRRRGRGYDPAVADLFIAHGEHWLGEIGDDALATVLGAEPEPVRTVDADHLDEALRAIADFVDLKSPWFRGHSPGVAARAVAAAESAALGADDVRLVGRAALVHDIGQVGVPSGVWDRAAALSAAQWERVRLHPYLTDRVLRGCAFLAPLADVASRHHERADGSGYHRGSSADADAARLLAVADAYQAITEERPHRPALDAAGAARVLRDGVAAGHFLAADVDAVLGVTAPAPPAVHPAGLSDREVEVLRLIARGRANKQVATALGISVKTVGRHIEHIYAKASVTTRAGATLFAMEHGLLR